MEDLLETGTTRHVQPVTFPFILILSSFFPFSSIQESIGFGFVRQDLSYCVLCADQKCRTCRSIGMTTRRRPSGFSGSFLLLYFSFLFIFDTDLFASNGGGHC